MGVVFVNHFRATREQYRIIENLERVPRADWHAMTAGVRKSLTIVLGSSGSGKGFLAHGLIDGMPSAFRELEAATTRQARIRKAMKGFESEEDKLVNLDFVNRGTQVDVQFPDGYYEFEDACPFEYSGALYAFDTTDFYAAIDLGQDLICQTKNEEAIEALIRHYGGEFRIILVHIDADILKQKEKLLKRIASTEEIQERLERIEEDNAEIRRVMEAVKERHSEVVVTTLTNGYEGEKLIRDYFKFRAEQNICPARTRLDVKSPFESLRSDVLIGGDKLVVYSNSANWHWFKPSEEGVVMRGQTVYLLRDHATLASFFAEDLGDVFKHFEDIRTDERNDAIEVPEKEMSFFSVVGGNMSSQVFEDAEGKRHHINCSVNLIIEVAPKGQGYYVYYSIDDVQLVDGVPRKLGIFPLVNDYNNRFLISDLKTESLEKAMEHARKELLKNIYLNNEEEHAKHLTFARMKKMAEMANKICEGLFPEK